MQLLREQMLAMLVKQLHQRLEIRRQSGRRCFRRGLCGRRWPPPATRPPPTAAQHRRRVGQVGGVDQPQERHGRGFLRIGRDLDVAQPLQQHLPQPVDVGP